MDSWHGPQLAGCGESPCLVGCQADVAALLCVGWAIACRSPAEIAVAWRMADSALRERAPSCRPGSGRPTADFLAKNAGEELLATSWLSSLCWKPFSSMTVVADSGSCISTSVMRSKRSTIDNCELYSGIQASPTRILSGCTRSACQQARKIPVKYSAHD